MQRRQSHLTGELRPEWAAILEALPGWRWRRTTPPLQWDDGLAVLRGWVTDHPDATVTPTVTARTVYQGYPLGAWVHTMRQRYTRGILTPHQVTTLSGLPGWVWGQRDARYHHGLALLREHQQRTVPARPTQFYLHPTGFTWGAWVGRVRTLHRTGALTPERTAALEAVPGWQWNPQAHHWATTLTLL